MRKTYTILLKSTFCFLLIIAIQNRITAQCVSSSWQNGTVFSNNTGIGDFSFGTPSDAKLPDTKRATAASISSLSSGYTNNLIVKGFNFSIPSYASICGVTVEVQRKAGGLIFFTSVIDNQVKLIKNGSIIGSNKSKSDYWSDADKTVSYGGATDLWGISLTSADVNNAEFGIAISAEISGFFTLTASAEINYVRMKVDYNPILPVTLNYFTAEKKSNGVSLNWQTTETEDGSSITLQRNIGNGEWKALQSYALSFNYPNQKFTYSDNEYLNNDVVQYRLKIVLATGVTTYSDIRKINFNTAKELKVYPNPATDKIIVNATGVEVYDMVGRRIPINSQLQEGSTIVDLSKITPGMYLIKAGSHTQSFIKQ